MQLEKYINDKKEFYETLISFLDDESNAVNEKDFFNYLNKLNLDQYKTEMKQFIVLLSKISQNHQRSPSFIQKFVKILCNYQYAIKDYFSISDLFDIFNHSKSIFLLIYAVKMPKIPDLTNRFWDDIGIKFPKNHEYIKGIYYKINRNEIIRKFKENMDLDYSLQSKKKELSEKLDHFIENFDFDQEVGENDSPICQIIRKDLIDEFVIYVSQHNIPLSMKINFPITETNSFLLNHSYSTTLIDYAAFFGSFQIFQHLRLNNVELSPLLWLYAIHGRNPDIIHLLEETHFKTCDETYKSMLREAIKCHHNEIAFYIRDNLLSEAITQDEINIIGIENYNYSFYPDVFHNRPKEVYYNLIQNDGNIAQILIDEQLIEINQYEKCSHLQKLIIPSFVKEIEDNSFLECGSLIEITIPSSVTMIGENAFHGCKELEQIIIPDSVVMIKSGAFKSCVSLKELIIPSGVKSIGSQAFYECTSLKEIKLPPDITVIAEKTFKKCQALTQIDIPSKVKSIEKCSFSSCSSLEKITIPSSVISIEPFAFEKCSKLTKMDFELPSSLSEICPLTFGTSNNLYLSQSNFGCCQPHTPITEIFIPSSITSILPGAFEKCFYLTKITFEMTSKITSIGENAFRECIDLEKIIIPSSVTSIGKNAFYRCEYLKEVVFEEPVSITSLSDGIFMKCLRLKKIKIPSSIKSIGKNAFDQCKSLPSVVIPSSVTQIGTEAFKCCKKLKELSISPNINEIYEKTFSECLSLEKIEIPPSITRINNNSFYKCLSLVDILIHCSKIYIDPGAFKMCRKKNIVILNDEIHLTIKD
ncbi:hypothetical protein M9Y10_016713 [Tritrichomonas musculus]|uniref:Uncharacterized protein n=1 Tax=Tritrichomonas musculus TaxID=1915356 RepID=A0ABR2HX17_9EUKA